MNLSFFEKVPREYFCVYADGDPNEPQICTPDDFCDNPNVISYEPNMELSDSYHNWVENLSLECASSAKVGALGTSYFVGWLCTMLFLPRLSDLSGRKNLILSTLVVYLVFYSLVFVAPSYEVMIVVLFVIGCCSTAGVTLQSI